MQQTIKPSGEELASDDDAWDDEGEDYVAKLQEFDEDGESGCFINCTQHTGKQWSPAHVIAAQ